MSLGMTFSFSALDYHLLHQEKKQQIGTAGLSQRILEGLLLRTSLYRNECSPWVGATAFMLNFRQIISHHGIPDMKFL